MTTGVQYRCRFGRGPPRHSVEASLLLGRELSGSFRNVEDDRGCGSLKLIGQIASAPRQLLDHVVGQDEEAKSSLVDVEPLMIEVPHGVPSGRGKGKGRGRERLGSVSAPSLRMPADTDIGGGDGAKSHRSGDFPSSQIIHTLPNSEFVLVFVLRLGSRRVLACDRKRDQG